MRVSGRDAGPTDSTPSARTGRAVAEADLDRYRSAVTELLAELPDLVRADAAERLTERLLQPPFVSVLDATRQGMVGARESLLLEFARHRATGGAAGQHLADRVRIQLLSRVDAMWWQDEPAWLTDAQVAAAPGLVDVDRLHRQGLLRFRYEREPATSIGRRVRAARQRIRPAVAPATSGLSCRRTRPEMVALLSQIAHEFTLAVPSTTPPVWVTGLAWSMEHQHRLRQAGAPAALPSAHCVGYAVDVAMAWYRRFGAYEALATLLLGRQDAGEVNIIDEGESWHLCLAPAAVPRLRRAFDLEMGEVATCAVYS